MVLGFAMTYHMELMIFLLCATMFAQNLAWLATPPSAFYLVFRFSNPAEISRTGKEAPKRIWTESVSNKKIYDNLDKVHI